ncbi:MAG: hypothetical protein V1871_09680 [Planctomycetota bacterium]
MSKGSSGKGVVGRGSKGSCGGKKGRGAPPPNRPNPSGRQSGRGR